MSDPSVLNNPSIIISNCQRCDKELFAPTPLKLKGDYCATLCNDCVNAWHNLFINHDCNKEVRRLNILTDHYNSLALAGTPVKKKKWKKMNKDLQKLNKLSYDLAEEFVKASP